MIILCPHCGAEVSSKDKHCPYCNQPYDASGLTPARSVTDQMLADEYKRPEPKPMTPTRLNWAIFLAITCLTSLIGTIVTLCVTIFSKSATVSVTSCVLAFIFVVITLITGAILYKHF